MASNASAYLCEWKRRGVFVTGFCDLILFIALQASVQAAKAPHKTDTELTKELIGRWELVSGLSQGIKTYLVLGTDGRTKVIGITDDSGVPRRLEVEAKWGVTNGGLVVEKNKPSRYEFQLHDQIVSIENGVAVLRGEKGRSEMHRIGDLPNLPPLVTSTTGWMTLSAPKPIYPLAARQNGIQGRGIFKLVLGKGGQVDSIQLIKSTGSKVLDDAAEKALRQWRFKPGLVNAINVPVTFTMDSMARHRMAGTVITY